LEVSLDSIKEALLYEKIEKIELGVIYVSKNVS